MNAKPWYQSTTYYALAVAIATKIFMLAGLAESDAGKQAGELVTVLLPFIGIVADLVAAWGRKRAQGPLTLAPPKKSEPEVQGGQGGFARPLALAILLAIALPVVAVLPGCASLGLSPAQSFEDRIAYSQAQTTGLRDASTRALDAKLISSEDMEFCITLADRSSDMLRLTRIAYGQGDLATAEGRLMLVSGILTELENYLTTRSASR